MFTFSLSLVYVLSLYICVYSQLGMCVLHVLSVNTVLYRTVLTFSLNLCVLSVYIYVNFQFKSFCGSVTDVDYQDWFCGTSIHQNVRETVKEVLIPVLVEDFSPSSLSSLEEMFQMAPSAMMSKCQVNLSDLISIP